jgi:predicted small lipoprotein YifL
MAGEAKVRKLVLLALIAALAACGVKSDLTRPNGKPTAENERDPSRPPNQTGR